MTSIPGTPHQTKYILARADFQALLDALLAQGYRVIGPTVQDAAITLNDVHDVSELPIGRTDTQGNGTYRLQSRDDQALFGFTVGPHAWKRFLLPPVLRLWQAERTPEGFRIEANGQEEPRFAFLGVRACDLHAIEMQDRIFQHGHYVDPVYQQRRQQAFIVAVNCVQAGETCFCVSMAAGPQVETGFDLALTEILESDRHYFVVEVGSQRGAELLDQIPHQTATAAEAEKAECTVAAVTTKMGRSLETAGLHTLLCENLEHPNWDRVAEQCLACGNCTMVCPTCFCSTVEDVTTLSGNGAERWRKADSCFSVEFSHMFGGSVRTSTKARYRQWITHKLATWIDQFGTFGCVGCGRCITWCPVGIDITEEVNTLRRQEALVEATESGGT